MKVYFSRYQLTPIKRANRLSSLEKKPGVFLKATLNDNVMFADYFPHLPLGDRPLEVFFDEFKFQEDEYDRKVFDLLLKDSQFQNIKAKTVHCHQLWSGAEEVKSPVVKYKLQHAHDQAFLALLEKGIKVRLDGNAIFNRDTYQDFFSAIPQKLYPLIEYVEDPLSENDWSNLKLKSAQDFITGSPIDYYIYKPNCEFLPKLDVPVIFSGYLGSSFGFWQSYCELLNDGNLKERHGLIAHGYYEEDKAFLEGNYYDGFTPDPQIVRKLYQDLSNLEWKQLCSI